jgi:hypothetical protein
MGAAVKGSFVHTSPRPALLSALPRRAAAALAEQWPAGRPLAGVNADDEPADAFSAAWCSPMSARSALHRRERLYRLGTLMPPRPAPHGAPRGARTADRNLLVAWVSAFQQEISGAAAARPRARSRTV